MCLSETNLQRVLTEIVRDHADFWAVAPAVGQPGFFKWLEDEYRITAPLMDELWKVEPFRSTSNVMLHRGGGGTVSILAKGGATGIHQRFGLVPNLVKLAIDKGPEEAVRVLATLLDAKGAKIEACGLVWGPTLSERIEITKGVSIEPHPQGIDNDRPFASPAIPFHRRVGVTPTLIKVAFSEPHILIPIEKEPKEFDPTPLNRARDLVQLTALGLALEGPSPVVVERFWEQFADDELHALLPTFSSVISHHDVLPFFVSSTAVSEHVVAVVRQLLELEEVRQNELKAPLERFDLALRRTQIGDRALDAGIALEMLLADGDHTEIGFRIALRGALILGGDFEKKKRNRRIIKEVYGLRSQMAHTGHLSSKAGNDKKVSSGIELCGALLQHLILKREKPAWEIVELGGEK